MAHPIYVREKARSLRVEKHLSIDEIAKRLALPKTTIYYWVRDLPLGRPQRANRGQRKGNRAMRVKYRLRREAAYEQGRAEFAELAVDPLFRDFVCLYIAEGYKRSRNAVSICNSDPRIVRPRRPLDSPFRAESDEVLRPVSRGPGSRSHPRFLGRAARHPTRADPASAEVQQRPTPRAHVAV